MGIGQELGGRSDERHGSPVGTRIGSSPKWRYAGRSYTTEGTHVQRLADRYPPPFLAAAGHNKVADRRRRHFLGLRHQAHDLQLVRCSLATARSSSARSGPSPISDTRAAGMVCSKRLREREHVPDALRLDKPPDEQHRHVTRIFVRRQWLPGGSYAFSVITSCSSGSPAPVARTSFLIVYEHHVRNPAQQRERQPLGGRGDPVAQAAGTPALAHEVVDVGCYARAVALAR